MAADPFSDLDKIHGVGPQQGPGTGQGVIPGTPEAAAQVQANTAPPTQQRQVDPYHSTFFGSVGDTLRSLNQGVSGGLWNPAVAGVKSLVTGTPYSQNLAAEKQKSDDAWAVSPGSQIASGALGAVVGPGKLSQAENAARLAPGFISKLLTRLGGGAAEGSTYAGVNAAANQQPVLPAMEKGAAIGGPLSVAAPVVPAVASKLFGGKLAPPPTSSDYTPGPGNWSFRSTADQATAAKLKTLEDIENNVKYGTTDSLSSGIKPLFQRTPGAGPESADINNMGLTQEAKDALANVSKVGPVSKFMYQHPRVTQGAIGAVGEVPSMVLGLHGNVGEAIGAEALSTAGHVAAATLPGMRQSALQQQALDQAKRVITGQPTQTNAQQWLNDPRGIQALQAILYNRTINQ